MSTNKANSLMKNSNLVLLILVVILIAGCGPSREKKVARIEQLEKQLFSPDAVSFDKSKADSLVALYSDFLLTNPTDSLAPAYLFKAANISMNAGKPAEAVKMFDQYMKEYPDQPKAPMCLFLKAFTLENQLGELDRSRESYLLFIEKYPTHEFASQAQLALMNLGKSPEMLVREWDAKRTADSIRVADSLKKAGKTKGRK
jgi:outer membrane protein assembly factor BamD (BamD/ComL family)